MELITKDGRLYINKHERERFLKASQKVDRDAMCFGQVLLYTGCRLNEGVNLCVKDIDQNNGAIIFRTLKQRGKQKYRSVPIPPTLLTALNNVYGLREITQNKKLENRIWSFSDRTGQRKIKRIMDLAEVVGPQACAKGLRHGFGAYAVAEKKIPITIVQKLMGHAHLKTTAIYTNLQGEEERQVVSRMWE